MGECAAGHMTADNFWLADEIQSLFKTIKSYDHITWDEYPVHGQILLSRMNKAVMEKSKKLEKSKSQRRFLLCKNNKIPNNQERVQSTC